MNPRYLTIFLAFLVSLMLSGCIGSDDSDDPVTSNPDADRSIDDHLDRGTDFDDPDSPFSLVSVPEANEQMTLDVDGVFEAQAQIRTMEDYESIVQAMDRTQFIDHKASVLAHFDGVVEQPQWRSEFIAQADQIHPDGVYEQQCLNDGTARLLTKNRYGGQDDFHIHVVTYNECLMGIDGHGEVTATGSSVYYNENNPQSNVFYDDVTITDLNVTTDSGASYDMRYGLSAMFMEYDDGMKSLYSNYIWDEIRTDQDYFGLSNFRLNQWHYGHNSRQTRIEANDALAVADLGGAVSVNVDDDKRLRDDYDLELGPQPGVFDRDPSQGVMVIEGRDSDRIEIRYGHDDSGTGRVSIEINNAFFESFFHPDLVDYLPNLSGDSPGKYLDDGSES